MRQLPAPNSGATSTTENSRSRSHQESPGITLSNGTVKEPILTRSKSRLRVGRRLSGRSPRKPENNHKTNDYEGTPRKNPERGAGSSSASLSSPSPKNEGSKAEKMYARHYKSYRGLNGIKSRRGEQCVASENSSRSVRKKCSEDSPRNSLQLKNRQQASRTPQSRRSRIAPTKNDVHQNGRSPSSLTTRTPSSRIRQLVLKRKRQLPKRKLTEEPTSLSPSPQPSPTDEDSYDLFDHKDRVAKRRSALWVLNCEAESFLFGETAADKHEVELPPLTPPSPPPKKRRKWRVTELAHLLEKSPILESKLRKSSSSDSGSDMQRDISPPPKRLKPITPRTPRRVKTLQHREKTPEMCSTSSKSVKGRNHEQVLSPKPELLSPIPFLHSPSSIDYEARTVQYRQMLANCDWGYSFEEAPVGESWYPAFTRTEDSIVPYTSFVNSLLHKPLVLPYEMDKPIRRSRCKPSRNSRKSPRCHASTLAMLSSERPTRSTRSSVTLDNSPPASVNLQSPPDPTLSALLVSPTPTTSAVPSSSTTLVIPSSSTTPSRFSPPKCIPSTSRRRHLSSSPRPSPNIPLEELPCNLATQYIWDSIQLLSDPYVVAMLAGDDPNAPPELSKGKGVVKNPRCNNNNYVVNNCPVKHMMKNLETSDRKASLRSGDVSTTAATTTSVNPPILTNSRLVSVPKSSPRNHSHGTNHVGGRLVSSPQVSPANSVSERVVPMNGVSRRFTSRSPPLSPPTRQAVCQVSRLSPKNSKGTNSKQSKSIKGSGSEGDNGIINHEKSSKLSPVVLMRDLYNTTSKTKMNSWDEESLFIGDGLPPLPSWPV